MKALKRRLKSDNPKIVQLTLTLCEAAVKNCSRPLHQALGTREFLSEVAGLANGQKGFEVCYHGIHVSYHSVETKAPCVSCVLRAFHLLCRSSRVCK